MLAITLPVILQYAWVTWAGILGILFFIMKQIRGIRMDPTNTLTSPRDILAKLLANDWDLLVSAALGLVTVLSMGVNPVRLAVAWLFNVPEVAQNLIVFAFFMWVGFAGYRFLNKFMGSFDSVVDSKFSAFTSTLKP